MSLSGVSEATTTEANDNPNSIAALVYATGSKNGYHPPTTREIPQLRLAPLEPAAPDEEFRAYQQQLSDFTHVGGTVPVPPLDSVPAVYSQPNFSLDNPRVFAQVVSAETAIDYTILLEKMSWYIDIVELHLLESVSQASSSFFKVTSQFNDIEASARATTQTLADLGNKVKEISQFAMHERESLQIMDRLKDLEDLEKHLKQLTDFYRAYKECKALSTSDVPLLSTKIRPTLDLLTSPYDLRGVTAIEGPTAELHQLETRSKLFFENEIVNQLMQDLNRHILAVPENETLDRIGRILHIPGYKHTQSYNNTWAHVDPEFRAYLELIIRGAIDNNVIDAALHRYVEAMTREIKAIVRRPLPKSRDPDTAEGAGYLAQSLKALSSVEFEHMVATVYTTLAEALRRTLTHYKLLLDLCSSMGHPPLIGSILEDLMTITDDRIVKVLKVRKDIMLASSVDEYIHIYSLCGIFMSECESICGVYAPELSTYLASQTDAYATRFSSRHVDSLIKELNLDAWKKEELPQNFQLLVDLMVESGDQDPVTWLRQWRYAIDRNQDPPPKQRISPQNVFIKDSSFFISRSTVQLVSTLSELLKLICLLPQTTTLLSEQYLSLHEIFDNKLRSLILGTGAMTSGSGLQRITFRHLSLAYESLRFVQAILANTRLCIQRHMQDYSAFSTSADSLEARLKQHQDDIEQKFVSIMSDKSQSYARSITITNWEASPLQANQYMQNMVKDITTVSRILEDVLSGAVSERIVTRIFDIYKRMLLEAYTSLHIKDAGALDNVMRDIRYFKQNIQGVTGAGNLGEVLYESMSAFAIPEERSQMEQPQSPARTPMPTDVTVGDISEADIPSDSELQNGHGQIHKAGTTDSNQPASTGPSGGKGGPNESTPAASTLAELAEPSELVTELQDDTGFRGKESEDDRPPEIAQDGLEKNSGLYNEAKSTTKYGASKEPSPVSSEITPAASSPTSTPGKKKKKGKRGKKK